MGKCACVRVRRHWLCVLVSHGPGAFGTALCVLCIKYLLLLPPLRGGGWGSGRGEDVEGQLYDIKITLFVARLREDDDEALRHLLLGAKLPRRAFSESSVARRGYAACSTLPLRPAGRIQGALSRPWRDICPLHGTCRASVPASSKFECPCESVLRSCNSS